MRIVVNLDVVMAQRKMKLKDLDEEIGLAVTNLSPLKTEKARGIRFNTLSKICKVLDCQPGDILCYEDS